MNAIIDGLVNEARAPKWWDSMFAVKVINDYKSGKLTKNNIKEWDKAYNGGIDPKPAFNTREIIDYYEKTGKEPDK